MEKARIEVFQDCFFLRVIGRRPEPSEMGPLTCAQAQAALLELATTLQRRFPPRGEVDAIPVPEEALLEAIASMAEDGVMEAFASMSPRLRRAVRARLRSLLTAVMAYKVTGNNCISFLPRDIPDEHIGMALLMTMGVELPEDLRATLE